MALRKVLIPAYVERYGFGHPDQGLPEGPSGHPDQGLPDEPPYVDNTLPPYVDNGLPPIVIPPIFLPGHPSHPIYPVGGPGRPSHPIYPVIPIDPSWGVPIDPPKPPGWWIPVHPGNGLPPVLGWLPVDPGYGLPVGGGPDNTLPKPPGHWLPIDPGFGVGGCPSTPPARPKFWVWIAEIGPDFGTLPAPVPQPKKL
jgi:hypothetical protein